MFEGGGDERQIGELGLVSGLELTGGELAIQLRYRRQDCARFARLRHLHRFGLNPMAVEKLLRLFARQAVHLGP